MPILPLIIAHLVPTLDHVCFYEKVPFCSGIVLFRQKKSSIIWKKCLLYWKSALLAENVPHCLEKAPFCLKTVPFCLKRLPFQDNCPPFPQTLFYPLTTTTQAKGRKRALSDSHDLQRFLADRHELQQWMTNMLSQVSSDDISDSITGAEGLLHRHQVV